MGLSLFGVNGEMYSIPHRSRINNYFPAGYPPPTAISELKRVISSNTYQGGYGLLSGSFPLSLITQGGNLPSQAEIRILCRPKQGFSGDGDVVATSACNTDGTWQVSGLNENLKFDIVARIPGFNDVIISNVQPTGAPLTAHFANLKDEYEYQEEVEIQIVALGGIPPYTYTVLNLPDGLVFDPVTGMITGAMPSGDIDILIEVSDSSSDTAQVQWGGYVINPLPSYIGEEFGGGFYAGDIQYPDGQWYKLIVADISADITGANSRWKTSSDDTPGTDHLINGVSNTDAMVAAGIELHPAAKHCINHTGGGNSDWYMPAKDELNVLYLNLGFNRPDCPDRFRSGRDQAFHASTYYLPSTQSSAKNTWIQYFNNGNQLNYGEKNSTNRRVRPVRRLPFNP